MWVMWSNIDWNRSHDNPAPVFHPEFGRFMLEATPGKPWGIGFKDLLDVEPNMKWRYVVAHDLPRDCVLMCLSDAKLPRNTWRAQSFPSL